MSSSLQTSRSSASTMTTRRYFSFVRLKKLVKGRNRSSRTEETVSSLTTSEYDSSQTSRTFFFPTQKLTKTCRRSSTSSLKDLVVREETEKEASALMELGIQEQTAGRNEAALDCWLQALGLSHNCDVESDIHRKTLWNLTILHLQLASSTREDSHEKTQHSKNAHAYLYRLVAEEPISEEWLHKLSIDEPACCGLLEFLTELKQWPAALCLSKQMGRDTSQICYEMVTTTEHWDGCPCPDENVVLDRQVLNALIRSYMEKSDWDRALERNMELLDVLLSLSMEVSVVELTDVYSQQAHILAEQGEMASAWEVMEQGIRYAEDKQSGQEEGDEVQLALLQGKAELLFRMGRLGECLSAYGLILNQLQSKKGPICAEVAQTFYTMGNICSKVRCYREAVSFFSQELQVTKLLLGKNDLEVSRILHELARLFDEELGDYDRGLRYYRKALCVETIISGNSLELQLQCDECKLKVCTTHAQRNRDCQNQIRDTQQKIGRIHYKRGDFSMAMRTSFGDGSLPR